MPDAAVIGNDESRRLAPDRRGDLDDIRGQAGRHVHHIQGKTPLLLHHPGERY
jgi:hypothetical protein